MQNHPPQFGYFYCDLRGHCTDNQLLTVTGNLNEMSYFSIKILFPRSGLTVLAQHSDSSAKCGVFVSDVTFKESPREWLKSREESKWEFIKKKKKQWNKYHLSVWRTVGWEGKILTFMSFCFLSFKKQIIFQELETKVIHEVTGGNYLINI